MSTERKKRGRPPLGDRPLSRAEHEAKRRVRIADRLKETYAGLTNNIVEIRRLLSDLAALPAEAGKQAVQADLLAYSLHGRVELLLSDIGRIQGTSFSGIFRPGHIISLPQGGLGAIFGVTKTDVWVVPIIGKNGTPRHRAEVPIDNALRCGISIRYPIVECSFPFQISLSRLVKTAPSGILPLKLLQEIKDSIKTEELKRPFLDADRYRIAPF